MRYAKGVAYIVQRGEDFQHVDPRIIAELRSITVDGAADFELLDDGSGSVNLDNIRSRTDGD